MPRNKKAPAKRNSASHKTRTESKGRATKKTAKVVKIKTPVQSQQTSAGANRAQGIAMFKLAGRPSKEEFILVYGERGPKLTWSQRAAMGIPAERFQAALAEKAASRRPTAK